MEQDNSRPYNRNGKPLLFRYSRTRYKPRTNQSERDYDFLKWIRVVFKWATAHTGLTQPKIEILLYFYAKGAFSKQEFFDYFQLIGFGSQTTLKKFIQEGWIIEWRKGKRGRVKGMYDLTSKAKVVCSKMHKMCVGDMDVPVTRRSNPLNAKDIRDKRINKLYTGFFKVMNAERAERDKKKEEGE